MVGSGDAPAFESLPCGPVQPKADCFLAQASVFSSVEWDDDTAAALGLLWVLIVMVGRSLSTEPTCSRPTSGSPRTWMWPPAPQTGLDSVP